MSDGWEQPKSKLRQAAQQALEALELVTHCFLDTTGSYGDYENEALESAYAAITALLSALDQPVYKSQQVRPAEFVEIVKGRETVTGVPMFWSEWPTE